MTLAKLESVVSVLAAREGRPSRPVLTLVTTVRVPVTVVEYVDEGGRVLAVATYVFRAPPTALPAAVGRELRAVTPEEVVRALEAAHDAGLDVDSVLRSYVPPPPPWMPVRVEPPPSDPRLRALWRRRTASAVAQLMNVELRRRLAMERLEQLRQQLLSRLATEVGPNAASRAVDEVVGELVRRLRSARSVWDVYSVERVLTLDRLLELAKSRLGGGRA